MGDRLGMRDKNKFECLWIVDFPLFEWSDEEQRLMATHHPFTMPNPDDIPLLDSHPEQVRAKAYDFVCNGVELGGGSLRIHDGKLQEKMFRILGFTPEKAMAQFGFLINAFKYGAPPHACLAFVLDRFVSIMAGLDSIRDCIAFPKNNSGRDVMLDAPSALDDKQLEELQIKVDLRQDKQENIKKNIFKTVIFRFKSVQIHYFTLTLQCVLKMRIEQLLPQEAVLQTKIMAEKKTTKTAATKAAAEKKETVKKCATRKCATKKAVVSLTAENVGFKAGDVYQTLAAAGNALTVAEIAKTAGITTEEAFLGIGWLLKEGKVQAEDDKVVLA